MTIEELFHRLFPGKEGAWLTLLQATGVVHLHHYRQEGTPPELLDMLNACLQKLWLRPAGKERWEIKDDHLSLAQKNDIATALQSIGLYDAVAPTQKKYDGVILMDGSEDSTHLRLNYLIQHWHNGLRFQRLYVMTADRPLDLAHEPIGHVLLALGLPADEFDMMKYVVAEALKEPGMFDGAEIVYVHALPQYAAKRATTSDNFISWENAHGVGSPAAFDDHHLLIVTNQPYVAYQGAVAAQHFSKDFTTAVHNVDEKETHFKIFGKYEIETIGDGTQQLSTTVGLDTLARYVYASRARWNALFIGHG